MRRQQSGWSHLYQLLIDPLPLQGFVRRPKVPFPYNLRLLNASNSYTHKISLVLLICCAIAYCLALFRCCHNPAHLVAFFSRASPSPGQASASTFTILLQRQIFKETSLPQGYTSLFKLSHRALTGRWRLCCFNSSRKKSPLSYEVSSFCASLHGCLRVFNGMESQKQSKGAWSPVERKNERRREGKNHLF